MIYLRFDWIHDKASEPIHLYSELDAHRWEVRKIEVFRDGRLGYASTDGSCGGTRLGEEPVPELDEIARDSRCRPVEITQETFEAIWRGRLASMTLARLIG